MVTITATNNASNQISAILPGVITQSSASIISLSSHPHQLKRAEHSTDQLPMAPGRTQGKRGFEGFNFKSGHDPMQCDFRRRPDRPTPRTGGGRIVASIR